MTDKTLTRRARTLSPRDRGLLPELDCGLLPLESPIVAVESRVGGGELTKSLRFILQADYFVQNNLGHRHRKVVVPLAK